MASFLCVQEATNAHTLPLGKVNTSASSWLSASVQALLCWGISGALSQARSSFGIIQVQIQSTWSHAGAKPSGPFSHGHHENERMRNRKHEGESNMAEHNGRCALASSWATACEELSTTSCQDMSDFTSVLQTSHFSGHSASNVSMLASWRTCKLWKFQNRYTEMSHSVLLVPGFPW